MLCYVKYLNLFKLSSLSSLSGFEVFGLSVECKQNNSYSGYIIHMSKRNFDFIKLFLQSSPTSQHRRFMKIITVPQSHTVVPPPFIPDEQYVNSYIRYLQSFPSSTHKGGLSEQVFKKMSSMHKIYNRPSSKPASQVQQLLQNIKDFTAYSNDSPIFYQELEQLITIAKPQTIIEVRSRLNYLFKIILNRRDKLSPNSLELVANMELSEAIIKAFSKTAKQSESSHEWRKLQAMQKLLRARQYQKKGFSQMAMANFQEVFSDYEAESGTRMQALKNICSQGDITVLESLMNLSQEKGQKQFEEYIKQSIQRLKSRVNSKTND